MRRVRWLAAVLAAVLSLSAMAAVAQDSGHLADVRSRLQQVANDLAAAQRQAGAAEAQLADAEARLAEVEAIVNEVARRIEQQEERAEQARIRLEELQQQAEEVQAAFDARAIQMFKHSFGTDLDLVLSAVDIEEALDRQTLLDRVNRSDRATLEHVRASQGAVLTQQEALDGEMVLLEQLRTEQEEILVQVRQIRQDRAMAAAEARARAVELGRQHGDLQGEERRIRELIEQRAQMERATAPTALSAGGFMWPACGRVTSEFGRRWGRLHAGIDIVENNTRAIYASRGGRVIFAGWQGGYGQLTMIDHGGGVVTAYAHQSRIGVSEGQSVSQGQRIGTIGNTGNSTGPHLHFEIRVNGTAQNPRNYLPRRC
jgi:murein DD-endopeptidase MepM/ murein hydrolase activator NlpD